MDNLKSKLPNGRKGVSEIKNQQKFRSQRYYVHFKFWTRIGHFLLKNWRYCDRIGGDIVFKLNCDRFVGGSPMEKSPFDLQLIAKIEASTEDRLKRKTSKKLS